MSSSASSSHDCLLCCAFNAFLQQHKCYHRLSTSSSSGSSVTIGVKSARNSPSPTPAPSWFIQNDVSREEVANMLSNRPVGSFFVRPSKTCGVGSFVLSVRVPVFVNGNGIAHYLIVKTLSNRFKFQGLNDKEWSDIESLVVHHTIMREFLPCTLQLPSDCNSSTCGAANLVLTSSHQYSSSTLHSAASSVGSSSSSSSATARLSRAASSVRSRSNDHEVLSDFLQSIRSRSSSARINSPSRDVPNFQRPTVCY